MIILCIYLSRNEGFFEYILLDAIVQIEYIKNVYL